MDIGKPRRRITIKPGRRTAPAPAPKREPVRKKEPAKT